MRSLGGPAKGGSAGEGAAGRRALLSAMAGKGEAATPARFPFFPLPGAQPRAAQPKPKPSPAQPSPGRAGGGASAASNSGGHSGACAPGRSRPSLRRGAA